MFKDISIIYNFNNIKEDTPTKIERLKADYNELVKEGDFYKSLKRLFSIYKIKKEYPKLKQLTNIGKLYESNSNLKTIQLLKTMYHDIQTKKRIDINLKFLKIDPKENLNGLIKANDIFLNENAKKIHVI